MSEFKQLKLKSDSVKVVGEAVNLLQQIGYKAHHGFFSIQYACLHGGLCAWGDGEVTEGWLGDGRFKQITLEELKEMVGETEEVLWLNKNTFEEKYLKSGNAIKGIDWVRVPEGATFATGDKDNFVFRKDGWYYDNQTGWWVKGYVNLQELYKHEFMKLFWVKSDAKGGGLSNNFTVAWEQVFGEKFIDSVIKAVKQNKDITVKNDTFTLERLLGCEVLFVDTLYYVRYIYHAGTVGHLVLETDTRRAYVSDFNLLTFFTEDGDELTFDEYVQLYYPEG